MWRSERADEDDLVVAMCLDLNREDPGPTSVPSEHVSRTLVALRDAPWRGRAVVLDVGGHAVGYALLVAFWSNELGGEVCEVDELFVAPEHRGQGHGGSLFAAIERGDVWPSAPVAIALGVTVDNGRARRLYERSGFSVVGVAMVKRLAPRSQ